MAKERKEMSTGSLSLNQFNPTQNVLNQPAVILRPKSRLVAQFFITLVFGLSVYAAYVTTPIVQKSVPRLTTSSSGQEWDEVPSWFVVVMGLVAVVPAVWIFYFLSVT